MGKYQMNQKYVYRDFEYIMVMFELNKKNYTERMYRTLIAQKLFCLGILYLPVVLNNKINIIGQHLI